MSAGGAGFRPAASSLASTNRSRSDIGHRPSFTAGTGDLPTGRRAQNSAGSAAATFAAPGNGAPLSTHAARSAISESFSFPSGGIFSTPSEWRIARRSRLSSGLTGTMSGFPEPPPFLSAPAESSRRPDICLSAPWHLRHFSASSGRMRVSKNRPSSGVDGSAAGAGKGRTVTHRRARPAMSGRVLTRSLMGRSVGGGRFGGGGSRL